jgi:hypothetical protein
MQRCKQQLHILHSELHDQADCLLCAFLLCPAACSGGRFLGLLGSLTTWAARSTALAALAASYSSSSNSSANRPRSGAASRGAAALGASAVVRGQLASSRLLDVLQGWLQQARREKQLTAIKQLLQVGPHAPAWRSLALQRCCSSAGAGPAQQLAGMWDIRMWSHWSTAVLCCCCR